MMPLHFTLPPRQLRFPACAHRLPMLYRCHLWIEDFGDEPVGAILGTVLRGTDGDCSGVLRLCVR